MIKLLGLATLLALLAGCATNQPLEGAWRSKVQFTVGDFSAITDGEFLFAFNHGGTMTESSNYDGAPPTPPAYGVWRPLGGNRYEAVYVFYMTKPPEKADQLAQGWLPAGHGELNELIELAPDGQSFDSTITYRLFDTTGKQLPGVSGRGEGAGHAQRIGFR